MEWKGEDQNGDAEDAGRKTEAEWRGRKEKREEGKQEGKYGHKKNRRETKLII